MTVTEVTEPSVTRLDRLRKTLIEQSNRLNKIDELIATAPARERELLAEHLANASTLPGAIGPVEELRRKRREAEKSRPTVQANIDALNTAVLEEEEKERASVMADVGVEVSRYQDLIRDGWRRCGRKFEELNGEWIKLVDVITEFAEFREANAARISNDGDTQDRWRYNHANFVVEFVPGDLMQLVLDLYEVMADPTGMCYRRDQYPEARPYDEFDQLRKLVGDLRQTEGRLHIARSDRVRYSQQRSIQGMNL